MYNRAVSERTHREIEMNWLSDKKQEFRGKEKRNTKQDGHRVHQEQTPRKPK